MHGTGDLAPVSDDALVTAHGVVVEVNDSFM